METAGYATLSRQSGLMRELQVVANNVANAATTGYRQEGLIFSEFVSGKSDEGSVSMGQARVANTSLEQGTLTQTNGSFDFAIEGDGFFLVETPAGERLTRYGSFIPTAAGELVTPDGHRLLDPGGTAVFVPPGAEEIGVSNDGTISVDGQPLGQIGLVLPAEGARLTREDGVMFASDIGTEPAPQARVLQGHLEGSNVNPIQQIARMVEIQRAYELGQSFAEKENERIGNAIKTFFK
jgi:flagellar basal-body rod protein FlgF